MHRTTFIRNPWLFALILILIGFALDATANDKGEQLRRAMAEIALLNGQMAQRKVDAANARDALTQKQQAFKTEALQIVRENKLSTQAQALEHPRVYYNLMLIAEIDAYIDRYTKKIAYYRVACDRLSYLYQQADDDLKIVNTLSDLKIDALIGQTQKILDGYLPDAQTIVIDPATLNVDRPETLLAAMKWVKK